MSLSLMPPNALVGLITFGKMVRSMALSAHYLADFLLNFNKKTLHYTCVTPDHVIFLLVSGSCP